MKQIIDYITSHLSDLYDADEARALAWWVVEEMTGLTRANLQIDDKDSTKFPNVQIFDPIIARLRQFEPIQYIFGHTFWCGLDLKLTKATLIPRPETAELVERISHSSLPVSSSPFRVLDVGTGSGCIALALKQKQPEWEITGIDISVEAIEIARENATRNHLNVSFLQTDIFSKEIENQSYDLIVSNPPYIRECEKKDMRLNVLNFEPPSALFVPDDDPLLFYRRIASLRIATYLFFEINENLSVEIEQMLKNLNYENIQLANDIYGKPRIFQARITR